MGFLQGLAAVVVVAAACSQSQPVVSAAAAPCFFVMPIKMSFFVLNKIILFSDEHTKSVYSKKSSVKKVCPSLRLLNWIEGTGS